MFKFYKMVTNTETNEEKIVECQYAQTPESVALKEQITKEISEYELYSIDYTDMYYHYRRDESTNPIDPATAVFKDGHFVGCMIKGVFCSKEGGLRSVSSDKDVKIRKKEKKTSI